MEGMRRLLLVDARHGKPVLHWPRLFLLAALMVSAMILVRRALEWIWNAADSAHPIESWRSTILSASVATVVIIAMFVVLTWKRSAVGSSSCGCDDSSRPVAP
jgi:hypothetical protein